jgi:release factor glutamine methyltransferase
MTIRDLVSAAANRLKRARIEEPRLEAESLLAYLLHRDLSWPLAHPEAEVAPAVSKAFAALIARRARHVPYAYLIGEKAFYGRSFLVTPAVLIPRPETETLVEAVLSRLSSRAKRSAAEGSVSILDIGTGAGAIGLTLAAELPEARVIAIDISAKALAVAKLNAKRLKAGKRVKFLKLDILKSNRSLGFARDDKKGVFILVANLPYLPTATWQRAQPEVRAHEPKLALASGADGLRHYRALFKGLARWKRKPDLLAIEAEPGQFPELARMIGEALPGLKTEILKDLHGDGRVLIASK